MSSDMFTQYLHQNYIEFFEDMDDVVSYAMHTHGLMSTETAWLCFIEPSMSLTTIKSQWPAVNILLSTYVLDSEHVCVCVLPLPRFYGQIAGYGICVHM